MDNKILVTEHELNEMHDEMLDECFEEVRIGNLIYSPSQVLKSVDPIAYRCSVADYVDSLLSDGVLEEIDGEYYR